MPDNDLYQGATKTFATWDDDFLYLALVGPSSEARIVLDGSADNAFFGPDNYHLALRNDLDFRSVQINVGVPDIFRQIDNDGQFSEFFDTNPQFTKPYLGRTIFNNPNDGLGFDGRLVTENDLVYARGGSGNERVWEVAIPWSDVTQLRGFSGNTMAISIEVSGDRLFESDHASRFTLLGGIPGDYNNDQSVDAADYVVWRKSMGQSVPPFSGADGDGNGIVSQQDYGVWLANFGQSVLVPEGSAIGSSASTDITVISVSEQNTAIRSPQGNALARQIAPSRLALVEQMAVGGAVTTPWVDRPNPPQQLFARRSTEIVSQRDLLFAVFYRSSVRPAFAPVDWNSVNEITVPSSKSIFASVDEVFSLAWSRPYDHADPRTGQK